MQYNENMAKMIGHVRRFKPNVPPDMVKDWLNYRQRTVIDRRPFWSGLFRNVTVNIPDQYNTGQISLFTGSTVVVGLATNWPVNDYISTILPDGISQPGGQWVTPASMQNIDNNSVLYVDDGGTPEIVAVRQTNNEQFYAVFQFSHNPNCQAWMSSLVHRQLRMTERNPIYSIIAVTSDTLMVLDKAWSGTNMSEVGYQILKIYITIGSDVKTLMFCVDPVLGRQLEVNVPQGRVMAADPWRQAVDIPRWICDNYKNINNNFTYEVYPPPTAERQFNILYYAQWPDMMSSSDLPVPFIAPNVIVWGAIADALRHRAEPNDPYYDLVVANDYERRFEQGVADAMLADNSKAQMAYSWQYEQLYGMGGADFWRSHDADVFYGNV